MIEEMQAEAQALLSAGDYRQALAEFSVLREIRSRREGPYSTKYLSNLHDCVRCMSHLELWSDSTHLCRELHGKYVRTHGRGETDTVDVAKHWAWALVNLHDYPPAVRLYLLTADALWTTDPRQARRLLGAAVIHRDSTGTAELFAPELIDGVGLRHADETRRAVDELAAELADDADPDRVTFEGLAVV